MSDTLVCPECDYDRFNCGVTGRQRTTFKTGPNGVEIDTVGRVEHVTTDTDTILCRNCDAELTEDELVVIDDG